MRMRKFTARSMREALIEIKKELGEDAVILKTRKVPSGTFPFGAMDIEVTAAIDETSAAKPAFAPISVGADAVYTRPRSSCVVDNAEQVEIRPWRPPGMEASRRRSQSKSARGDDSDYAVIKEDLRQLKSLVRKVVEGEAAAPRSGLADGWAVLYKRLVDSEVKPDIAEALMKNLKDTGIVSDGVAESRILDLLGANFPVAGPLRCKTKGPSVVAFVGPTGSGKTTTIAKLTAHCCLSRKKKVSLITADTYRIAAIDQIRTFAEIVKVGLHVVFSPEEAVAALGKCAQDDLVFIDTAGRSQRNTGHMEELRATLSAIKPDEIHLVVSATTKDSDLLDTVERYRDLGINRLLFSKLDETVHVGNIFNTVNKSGIPVSFFSNGQSVPDDIEIAHPVRFVKRLWERSAS